VSPSDVVFLRATVALAERGRFTCAPNPTVGCIIVRDGGIIGRGFHQLTGRAHAEVNAIADAGGDVVGATVYVSLEPCAFVGRTPACAQTLIDAKVARVVVAAEDPHPKVAGRGLEMLRQAGIEANLITQPEALQLISGYTSREISGRPFVRIKTASSLDGAMALANGESQWITGSTARQDVQYWRARSDAIVTGVGTVLADDPQLNVRLETYSDCRQPLRVVLDSTLRIPAEARILQGGNTLLVHVRGIEVPSYLQAIPNVELLGLEHGPTDLQAVLEHLALLGCNEVLVEAGPKVCGSFATNTSSTRLWDEWLCYVAPKWLGSASRPLADFALDVLANAPRSSIIETMNIGEDLRIRLAFRNQEDEQR